MADDHRRVEPRPSIGAGMAADPERIDSLRQDWERAERTWRAAPAKKFSEVMVDAPEERPGSEHRRHTKSDRQESPAEDAPTRTNSTDLGAADATDDDPALPPQGVLPRAQPDPSMRELHARFEPASLETPPATAAEEEVDRVGSPKPGLEERLATQKKASMMPRNVRRAKSPKRIRG